MHLEVIKRGLGPVVVLELGPMAVDEATELVATLAQLPVTADPLGQLAGAASDAVDRWTDEALMR